jgi:hypothetical protein
MVRAGLLAAVAVLGATTFLVALWRPDRRAGPE